MSLDIQPVIVGLSARVPGPVGNAGMWESLSLGRCTITQANDRLFDPKRYLDSRPGQAGKAYSMAAGQVSGAHHLDHAFFGISPRAAMQMDPQQKLMLRSVWEAIEDSRLSVADLAGDRTGVFVGSSLVENLSPFYYDPARADSQMVLGNTLCIIANRVSATFDFRGPSHVVDTACASSLYALHQAVEALQSGTIDTAIVGGVHITRTPGGYVGFSQARMMSPTGLSRAFDAKADGYVRSEASVAVILQRPDVAQRMGARVRARIRASGLNTDGQTSQLTIPSMTQQERLMTRVLQASGVGPDDLAFHEAHGTGTAVGDPIEAHSIGTAIGRWRMKPLPIGSSKTNFGHSEPAAGLVGLAKVLLSFEHGALPASLHFDTPNPNIDFEALRLRVNTELMPLDTARPLIAGVNSFGFGGTNVCAIVEAMRPDRTPGLVPGTALPIPAEPRWLMLSAASPEALPVLAGTWADLLDRTPAGEWAAMAATQARGATFVERLAVPLDADTPARLRRLAGGENDAGIILGQTQGRKPATVFAFPGNGVQTARMGQAEYRRSALFRGHLDRIAAEFLAQGGPDILALMEDPELDRRLGETVVAQAMLFAYQVAMAESLIEAGLEPQILVGHSAGEIASMHVAGCYGLQEAVRVVLWRAGTLDTLRGQGGMAAIGASEDRVKQALQRLGSDDLVIAAINSPRSVTVSGSDDALDRLAALQIDGQRLPMVRLRIEIPYHSPLLDPLQRDFARALSDITFQPARRTLASSVHGRILTGNELGPRVFWRNTRQPVRFADAMLAIADRGPAQVVEISPGAALVGNCRDLSRDKGIALDHFGLAASLQAEDDQAPDLFEQILARAWCQGMAIDLERLCGTAALPRPALPTYPLQETEHVASISPDGIDGWGEASSRRLTGLRADRASMTWTVDLTPAAPTWVSEHKVGQHLLIPATALAEIALGAARDHWPDAGLVLREFDLVTAMQIENAGVRVRTTLDPRTGEITISSRPRMSHDDFSVVARGLVEQLIAPMPTLVPRHSGPEVGIAGIYPALRKAGLMHGHPFRRISNLRQSQGQALWIELAPSRLEDPATLDFTGLDASFHSLARLLQDSAMIAQDRNRTLVPVRFGRLELWRHDAEARHAHLEVTRQREHSVVADIELRDADDQLIARAIGVEFAAIRIDLARQPATIDLVARPMRLRLQDGDIRLPEGWQQPAHRLDQLGYQPEAPAESRQERHLAQLRLHLVRDPDQESLLPTTILARQPDLAADLREMTLRTSGHDAGSVSQYGWSHRQLWLEMERLLADMLDGWMAGERLNLRILGLPHAGVLQRLAEDARIDRITLVHPDPVIQAQLTRLLPQDLAPLVGDWNDTAAAAHDLLFDLTGSGIDSAVLQGLAPGGLAFALDIPALSVVSGDVPPPDMQCHLPGSDLPLRLRLWQPRAEAPARADFTAHLTAAEFLPEFAHLVPPEPQVDPELQVLVLEHDDRRDPVRLLTEHLGYLMGLLFAGHQRIVLVYVDRSGGDASLSTILAALTAALRSIANEYPDQRVGLVAVHDLPPLVDRATLMRWCAAALDHQRVDIREGGASTPVFIAAPASPTDQPLVLAQHERGDFATLSWRDQPLAELAPDQIEVEVHATGLNFRDVMLARGLLPERLLDLGNSGSGIGMECAGIIRRVGADVRDLQVGMPVMALATGGFANRVLLPASAVTPVPPGLGLEQAASVPVIFLTAWHALHEVARLRAGERVLIHGGAGGVGLAAIQIARALGAEVHATAGSEDRRMIARAFGAQHLHDSRSLDFATEIMEITGGRGVDVVLNSLSGEAMRRSLGCLAPFGRFIELGKRDFLDGSVIDLRPFLRNVSYHGVDLDQIVAAAPELAQQAMARIAQSFAAGDLRPVPCTIHPANDVAQAFGDMLAARHVGKILITPPPVPSVVAPPEPIRGNWVILGGTGGLGLSVARRLLQEGAAHVHLLSRSGEISLLDKEEHAWVNTHPSVSMHAVDGANEDALEACLAAIEAQTGPIEGVIHAAMMLRDRMIKDLDASQLQLVLRNKLGVGLALDNVLRQRGEQPRHVIFFSSIVAQIANIGQVAYAMANAAIEAVIEQRRRDGLPGLAIGWGPVLDAGHLKHDHLTAARIARTQGIAMSSVTELCDELMALIRRDQQGVRTHAAIAWDRLVELLPTLERPAFARLLASQRPRHVSTGEFMALLRAASPQQARLMLHEEIAKILSGILRIPAEQVDLDRPLSSYGLDSLMAMELRMEIERRFGKTLPVSGLSQSITAARIAAHVLSSLHEDSPSASTPSTE